MGVEGWLVTLGRVGSKLETEFWEGGGEGQ